MGDCLLLSFWWLIFLRDDLVIQGTEYCGWDLLEFQEEDALWVLGPGVVLPHLTKWILFLWGKQFCLDFSLYNEISKLAAPSYICVYYGFSEILLSTCLSAYGQLIPMNVFLFIRLKQLWKSKCFDACLWNSTFFLVLSSFFQSKQLYPFHIWWRKRNIFLLKSLISMCIRGLNKGRNLHVKLLLCSCCPFHDAHDNLKNMSSSASTSKFSSRKWSLFSLCN